MQSNERRLAALEAKVSTETSSINVIQVTVEAGETTAEAIKKAGHDPDAANTLYVCFAPRR